MRTKTICIALAIAACASDAIASVGFWPWINPAPELEFKTQDKRLSASLQLDINNSPALLDTSIVFDHEKKTATLGFVVIQNPDLYAKSRRRAQIEWQLGEINQKDYIFQVRGSNVSFETQKLKTLLPVLAATEQITVTKTYGGIIDISARLTDDEPPPLNGEKFEPLLVIRTQQEYADLLRRIPTEGISQGAPAPKNNDPILQKPQIDFTNKMLVVVIRASVDVPEIRKVIRKDGAIVLETELSDHSLPRPYGTGTYSAVLIPLSRDKVIVQDTERKMKDVEIQPSAGGDVDPATKP